MATANYYHMFELEPTASDIDIKRRYRQLSFEHHPDRGGNAEMMMQINEAYTVLSDTILRQEYDRRYAAGQTDQTYTTTADEYYRRPAPRTDERSTLWVWLVTLGLISFMIVAYLLYGAMKPALDTNEDVPISSLDHRSAHSHAVTYQIL